MVWNTAAFLEEVTPPKGLVLLRETQSAQDFDTGWGATSCRSTPPTTPTPYAAAFLRPKGPAPSGLCFPPEPLPLVPPPPPPTAPRTGATPTPGAQSPPGHSADWGLSSTPGCGGVGSRGGHGGQLTQKPGSCSREPACCAAIPRETNTARNQYRARDAARQLPNAGCRGLGARCSLFAFSAPSVFHSKSAPPLGGKEEGLV